MAVLGRRLTSDRAPGRAALVTTGPTPTAAHQAATLSTASLPIVGERDDGRGAIERSAGATQPPSPTTSSSKLHALQRRLTTNGVHQGARTRLPELIEGGFALHGRDVLKSVGPLLLYLIILLTLLARPVWSLVSYLALLYISTVRGCR